MNKLHRRPARIDVRRRARQALASSIVLRALCVFAFLGARAVYAQPGARDTDEDRSRPNEKITFTLKDGTDSWLVPLPNWSLEDVMKTIDAQEEEKITTPYSIQSVNARGRVEKGLARLVIDVELDVADGTVRVPLGLAEGVYIPTPEQEESGESRQGGFSFRGPGLCTLDVDPETGEYVAIVQSPTRRFRRRASVQNREPSENEEQRRPEEPAPEQPAEPTPEQPAEPAPEQPAEPAPEQPAEPAPEQPAEPAPEQPAEPAPEQPSEPAPEQPAEPAPEQPAEPAPEQPAEPTAYLRLAGFSEAYASELLDPQEDERVVAENAGAERPVQQFHKYTLRLELCFCVEPIGKDEYRLLASFPPSAHSLLTLEAPSPDARISSVKGAVAAPPNAMSETTTELKLHGLGKGGERAELVWRQRVSSEDVVYQVENASIDVTLVARETTYDAALPIRVFGGESNEFYVRLPDGANLEVDSVSAVGAGSALFSVKSAREVALEEVPESLKAGLLQDESARGAFAKIQLEQSSTSVVLKLRARAFATAEEAAQEADASGATPARLLAGFGVLGAQKQNGQVKISCAEGLDFDVTPYYGASRDSDALNADERESYSFYTQPFLLKAQAFRRQAIVNVKPEYQATALLDGVELRARFKYSIYGMKATEVRLRLHDWKFRSDDANETLDLRRAYFNESSGEHVFPLKTPSDGVVVFELTFFREASLDKDGTTSLTLPTPVADWVEPSALVVTPYNNVALNVLKDRCVGLEQKSARSFSLELEQPKSTQESLYFQTNQIISNADDEQKDATLCATISKLEQEVDITCATEAVFSERGEFSVRQTFAYDVKNEPLEEIAIQAPRALLKAKATKTEAKEKKNDEKEVKADDKNPATGANVKFTVDGKAAIATLRENEAGEDDALTYVVSLSDQPRIGSFVVVVQYDYQSQSLEAGSTNNRIDLYLTQPYDADQLRLNTLRVSAKDTVYLTSNAVDEEEIGAQEDAENASGKTSVKRFWRQTEGGYLEDGSSWYMVFQSSMPETFIRFSGGLTSEKQGAPIVERAWVQTWFSNAARYDDAFYRVRCEKSALTVRLPDGTRRDRVAVSLNDKPFTNVSDPERGLFVGENTLRVPIPEELRSREFVLELSYMTSNKDLNAYTSNGRCYAQLPTFDSQTWVRRAYWQTIVPNTRHIVAPPKNWSSEYVVRRESRLGFFKRVASAKTDELYDWIGVEKKDRPDPYEQDANVYLFSSFNYNGTADESNDSEIKPVVSSFYLATRAALVLFGSGVALAIGLGLLYFPGVRSPLALFVLSLVSLTFSAFQPTLALIFLQTTALGIVLTLATTIIAAVFGRRLGRAENAPKRANDAPRVNSEGA
ncbi:MAG: hypothetical protein IJM54_03015 [Thermoguttaceae bacterium]|nr:hypothetical protein [Thermoguttaceae bacterium]